MSDDARPSARPWRRVYFIASAIFLASLVLVGYGVACALRPLPGDLKITPGAPDVVSLEWTTRGLTWRRWEPQHGLLPGNVPAVIPTEKWDFFSLRTGRGDFLSGQNVFPYRFWHVPSDTVSEFGALGIIIAACFVAYGHRLRSRLMEGKCPSCGYDLRATPRRCPECGTEP